MCLGGVFLIGGLVLPDILVDLVDFLEFLIGEEHAAPGSLDVLDLYLLDGPVKPAQYADLAHPLLFAGIDGAGVDVTADESIHRAVLNGKARRDVVDVPVRLLIPIYALDFVD